MWKSRREQKCQNVSVATKGWRTHSAIPLTISKHLLSPFYLSSLTTCTLPSWSFFTEPVLDIFNSSSTLVVSILSNSSPMIPCQSKQPHELLHFLLCDPLGQVGAQHKLWWPWVRAADGVESLQLSLPGRVLLGIRRVVLLFFNDGSLRCRGLAGLWCLLSCTSQRVEPWCSYIHGLWLFLQPR